MVINVTVWKKAWVPWPTNDSYERSLLTMPIETDSAFETVMVRFDVPHCSTVVRTFIESITVDISTDLSKGNRFLSGEILVEVHSQPAK